MPKFKGNNTQEKKDFYYNYMEDCIHLRACRRLQKIAEQYKGKRISRGCNNRCSAYTPTPVFEDDNNTYITVDEAISYARRGADSIGGGYDPYDIYCSEDLPGYSLAELVENYIKAYGYDNEEE